MDSILGFAESNIVRSGVSIIPEQIGLMQSRSKIWLAVLVLVTVVLTGCFGGDKTRYKLDISVEGEGSTLPKAGQHPYSENVLADLRATATEGWTFYGWGGKDGDKVSEQFAASTKLPLDRNREVTAFFYQGNDRVPVELTIPIFYQNSHGSAKDLTNKSPYPPGFRVQIQAKPEADDDVFLYWCAELTGASKLDTNGPSLDPKGYFDYYTSPDTYFTVQDQSAIIRAVFTKKEVCR